MDSSNIMTPIEQLPEHLKTISKSDWQQLFDILTEINQTKSFGEIIGGKKLSNGSIMMPFWVPAEIVERFLKLVYKLGIVPVFDWMNWKEGKKILCDKNKDYTLLNTITLCKLLTTIIRADRFNDGFLISCFEDGTISKIIKGLQVNLETNQ